MLILFCFVMDFTYDDITVCGTSKHKYIKRPALFATPLTKPKY